jgi:predicted Zn-dependent protease
MRLSSFLFFALTVLAIISTSYAQSNTDINRQDISGALSGMENALSTLGDDISPEDEYYIGRAVGASILQKYRPYTGNRALSAYLNRICGALALHAPGVFNGYHVMILDSQEINAFATSGGHIFVTLGLAEAAVSEDMLAAIIAHEMAHIRLRHGIEVIRDKRLAQELRRVAKRAGDMAVREAVLEARGRLFIDSVREIVDTMVVSGFSQQQEFEADSLAVSLLASAGYEPSSLIDTLRALEKTQRSRPGGIGKTHPPPALRISNVERTIRNYPVRDTRSFRAARFNAAVLYR